MPEKIQSKPSNDTFRKNYDEIEWRKKGEYCCYCSRSFDPEDKRIIHEDGHAECLSCNYN